MLFGDTWFRGFIDDFDVISGEIKKILSRRELKVETATCEIIAEQLLPREKLFRSLSRRKISIPRANVLERVSPVNSRRRFA